MNVNMQVEQDIENKVRVHDHVPSVTRRFASFQQYKSWRHHDETSRPRHVRMLMYVCKRAKLYVNEK